MRRILASVVSCIVAMGLACQVHAAAGKEQVRNLQRLETLTYKQATAFLMFTVQERNPAQHKKLEGLISEADSLVNASGIPAISSAWSGYKSTLLADPYVQGEVSADALIRMDVAQKTLSQAVHDNLVKIRQGSVVDANAEMIYDSAVKMEIITAVYLRRAADPMGGVTGVSQRDDPEQMALNFTNQFNKMLAVYKNKPEVYADLWTAYQKWNFIKGRVIDFNSKSVPYIIATYNDQITGKLQSAFDRVNH